MKTSKPCDVGNEYLIAKNEGSYDVYNDKGIMVFSSSDDMQSKKAQAA